MGVLSSVPLPPPFSFISSLSASDVEEVIRRFRVSPPKQNFGNDKIASASMSATHLYLTTILAGVVSNLLSSTPVPPPADESSSACDVAAILAAFYKSRLGYETRGDPPLKFARLLPPSPSPSPSPSSKASSPPPDPPPVNILPFISALVMFSSEGSDTRSKLSTLIDVFQFTKATSQELTKDTVTLIIVSLFRGMLVVMRDDELDSGSGTAEFNVSYIEQAVKELFSSIEECTDAHGNTTKKAAIPKETVLDWACSAFSTLPPVIESPSTVFAILHPTSEDH